MTTYHALLPRITDTSAGAGGVLDIRGASKDAFAPAIVHEPTSVIGNPDNQQFELRLTGETDAAGNPFVWIIAKHSGMALSVPFSPRFEQGAQVFQQPLMTHAPGREGAVQKWLQVLRHQDQQGQYFVYTNKWSSFALDVQGADPSNNVPVIEFGFKSTLAANPGHLGKHVRRRSRQIVDRRLCRAEAGDLELLGATGPGSRARRRAHIMPPRRPPGAGRTSKARDVRRTANS